MKRLFYSISIEVYRSLISNNPDAIFLLDVDGKVLDVNNAVENIFDIIKTKPSLLTG